MSPRPPRILIVDDEPALRNFIKAQLHRVLPTATILSTSSPEDALRILESGGVDMVVSDQHMPGGDGRALLARIAKRDHRTIRVLFSADPDAERDRKDIAAGTIHAALQKYVGGDELTRTLTRLLGVHHDPHPVVGRSGALDSTGAVARPTSATTVTSPRKRLLVVDDVPQLGLVIESVARRLSPPVDVVVETAGAAALEHIGKERFDAIMTDYRMPTVSGVQVLMQARAKQPHARRILLTGYNEVNESPERLAAAAIDAYVHKPVATHDLLLLLRDALSDDTSAMNGYREQARIMESEAARRSSALELDDS